MGCILPILSLFMPRLVLIGIAIFTDWISIAWPDGCFWMIVGWFFMPYTTLAYMAGMLHGGVSGGWLVLLIVAVFLDLGGQGSSATNRAD